MKYNIPFIYYLRLGSTLHVGMGLPKAGVTTTLMSRTDNAIMPILQMRSAGLRETNL